jgi:hypothetical protein
MDKACNTNGREVHTMFRWENLKETPQRIGIDGRLILKWILKKEDGSVWIRFIWLGIGTNTVLL